jgi:hypothetical protein
MGSQGGVDNVLLRVLIHAGHARETGSRYCNAGSQRDIVAANPVIE